MCPQFKKNIKYEDCHVWLSSLVRSNQPLEHNHDLFLENICFDRLTLIYNLGLILINIKVLNKFPKNFNTAQPNFLFVKI